MLTYKTAKGKKMEKRVESFRTHLQINCNKISEPERQAIFTIFYQLANYDLQSNFIASCIKKNNPNRVKMNALSKKNYVTIITLLNLRVCKEYFLNTLAISNKRCTTVCQKISAEGFVQTDQRGKHTPSNKVNDSKRSDVIRHIKQFPRYCSYYSRSQNDNTKYLSYCLNIKKMYELYCEWCYENEKVTARLICFDLQKSLQRRAASYN